jgi:hypothetical protein
VVGRPSPGFQPTTSCRPFAGCSCPARYVRVICDGRDAVCSCRPTAGCQPTASSAGQPTAASPSGTDIRKWINEWNSDPKPFT